MFFFGGYESVDDLIEKSIYLQDLCYKTMFEEMRRQAPKCSMAVNWDFNEPWPCAAGNSLVSWPAHPKSALDSVREALRPTLLSMDAPTNRYLTGETIKADIWMLNDSPDEQKTLTADIYLTDGKIKTKLSTVSVPACEARSNVRGGGFEFTVPEALSEKFAISVECKEKPELSSVYNLVHNRVETAKATASGDVTNEFTDFLK
jgi:beta-mannosidase